MLEYSRGICKLESLAALVNEISFVIILFCFIFPAEAYTFTLSHCPDTTVTGGEEEVWGYEN